MRFAKALLKLIVLLAVLFGIAWVTAPREHWPMAAEIDAPVPGEDLDAWLAQGEAVFPDITENTAKRIVWAGEVGARTSVALIYIHGYSASRQEIAPAPERIAQALGANLFETRLAGHGRPGDAMGQASAQDWAIDLAEAMAIARRLGDRVIIMGTSTGGSISTMAAMDPAYRDDIAALILVSPNFEINDPMAWLLDLPYARNWVPLAVGETRSWEPRNPMQARYWTTSYPTISVFPMRTVQSAARDADHGTATIPLLVFYAPGDQVVLPAATETVLENWGAPVTAHLVTDAEDPSQHVISGDILSPGQTAFTVETSLNWLAELGIGQE